MNKSIDVIVNSPDQARPLSFWQVAIPVGAATITAATACAVSQDMVEHFGLGKTEIVAAGTLINSAVRMPSFALFYFLLNRQQYVRDGSVQFRQVIKDAATVVGSALPMVLCSGIGLPIIDAVYLNANTPALKAGLYSALEVAAVYTTYMGIMVPRAQRSLSPHLDRALNYTKKQL